MADPASPPAKILTWDVPTRLFHWSLVGLILFAWWSLETHHMDWHKIAGSLVAGLLVFRLWWGVFGASTARFSGFVRGPRTIFAYLSGRGDKSHSGHNPVGALSVIALLLVCIAIIVFGLFAVDTDGIESGPLSNLVDFDQGRLASHLHGWAFEALEILVVLHLLAIIFYTFAKRQPLVPAMVHGHQPAKDGQTPLKPGSKWALVIGAVLGIAVSAVLIYYSR